MKEEQLKPPFPSDENNFFIDPRPRYIQLLDLFNNFWFGFLLASFFWVWPFFELAKIIGDAIALHCGAK